MIVDLLDGDRDRYFVALEQLEEAVAYEKIIVGLKSYSRGHGEAASNFLTKLADLHNKMPKITVVVNVDRSEDIEKIVNESII